MKRTTEIRPEDQEMLDFIVVKLMKFRKLDKICTHENENCKAALTGHKDQKLTNNYYCIILIFLLLKHIFIRSLFNINVKFLLKILMLRKSIHGLFY